MNESCVRSTTCDMPVARPTHDSFIDLTRHVHKMRSLTSDMPHIRYMCQIVWDVSMSRVSDIESGVRYIQGMSHVSARIFVVDLCCIHINADTWHWLPQH